MTILSKNIKYLRESKGLSQTAFCTELGFKKADLANWELGRNKPKIEKLNKIVEYFSITLDDLYNKDLSKSNSIEEKKNIDKRGNNNKFIPFYRDGNIHIGGEKKTSEDSSLKEYTEMIDAGDLFRDAGGAVLIYDDSMYPKYPAGSIILYKEILEKDFFVFGKDYLIQTTEYQMLKRVQKSSKEGYIMLCSYNEKIDVKGNLIYESIEIPINKIKRLFKIIGKAERNEGNTV